MRQKRRKKREPAQGSLFRNLTQCVKAALTGCVLTVILVLAIALLLKWDVIGEDNIAIATTIVKTVCAAFTGIVCAASVSKHQVIFSCFSGGLYIAAAFVSFSLVEQVFSITSAIFADLLLGMAASATAGFFFGKKQ